MTKSEGEEKGEKRRQAQIPFLIYFFTQCMFICKEFDL